MLNFKSYLHIHELGGLVHPHREAVLPLRRDQQLLHSLTHSLHPAETPGRLEPRTAHSNALTCLKVTSKHLCILVHNFAQPKLLLLLGAVGSDDLLQSHVELRIIFHQLQVRRIN